MRSDTSRYQQIKSNFNVLDQDTPEIVAAVAVHASDTENQARLHAAGSVAVPSPGSEAAVVWNDAQHARLPKPGGRGLGARTVARQPDTAPLTPDRRRPLRLMRPHRTCPATTAIVLVRQQHAGWENIRSQVGVTSLARKVS